MERAAAPAVKEKMLSGTAGCRLRRQSTTAQRAGSASSTRCWLLAVEVEDLAAGESQRDRIGGGPLAESRAVELEGAAIEVDEQGAGVRIGRVAVPGDAAVAMHGEPDLRNGVGVDAAPDRDQPGPEAAGGEPGAPGLGGSERRLDLEPGALPGLA